MSKEIKNRKKNKKIVTKIAKSNSKIAGVGKVEPEQLVSMAELDEKNFITDDK